MKMRLNPLFLFPLFIAIFAWEVRAQQPGGVDLSFSRPSANGPVFAVAETSAGYVWMGGYFNSVNSSPHASESYVSLSDSYFDLAVVNTNGSLDGSFQFPSYSSAFVNVFGGALYEYYVSAIAVDSNDVVFVAFNQINYGSSIIARFDPSGSGSWTFNSSFAAATKNQFTVIYSLAVDGSTLYVAGKYNNNYSSLHYNTTLARLNYAGTPDTSYTLPPAVVPYYSSDVYQVRYLSQSAGFTNNSLLICGGFGVARIATSGTNVYVFFNTSFQPTCAATRPDAQQLACPAPTGEILAGGDSCPFSPDANIDENSRIVDGFYLQRYGAATNNTLPVLTIPNSQRYNGTSIARVEALPDGDVLISGDFSQVNGAYVNNFAHLLPDGTVDTTFGNNTGIYVFDMVKLKNGEFLLGGGGEYTAPVFGGEYGYVERRYAPAPSGVTITTQPTPTNQSVYVGDEVYYSAAVSSSPGVLAQWMQNGTNLPGQTNLYLYFTATGTNNLGIYQLVVSNASYCPVTAVSSNVSLTVLPAPAEPANDLFANAFSLSGTNVVTNGYVRSSTLEAGEPDHAGNSQGYSVWYKWTAPGNGSVTIVVSGSDFSAALGIYIGTAVNALTLVTNNCNLQSDGEGGYYCNGVKGSATFQAVAGTTYDIAVGGAPNPGSLGNIALMLSETLESGPSSPVVTNSSWTLVNSNASFDLNSVAVGGGRIVTGGYPPIVFNSVDASNWTSVNLGLPAGNVILAVSYANGQFTLDGYDRLFATSSNGSSWKIQNLSNSGITNDYIYNTVFAQGLYVAAAENGTILTSPDTTNWTATATNAGNYPADWLYKTAYGNGVFVAVGDDATILTSTNGTNWTLQAGPMTGDSWYSVAFGNGMFVAVGDQCNIASSPDGTNWTLQTSLVDNHNSFDDVAFGNGRFVAVGSGGNLVLSSDGTNWVRDASGTTQDLYGVAYYQSNQFVVVGSGGVILVNQLPTFKSVVPAANGSGGLQFTLVGLSGATAIIQASTSLASPNWQPLLTNVFTNGTITFTDSPANSSRFYRAVVK